MLILASASPRRHELLLAAGIPHEVRAASVLEQLVPGELPVSFVKRLAAEKVAAILCNAGDIVLGADTIVCIGNQVLGKPSDHRDAYRMLRLLSGREHLVHTGICLRSNTREISDAATTKVRFAELTEAEIADYVRSGEPKDKAGAYAIQGLASKFILSIEGCYHNVVGLPVSLVYRHLKTL